MPGGLVEEWQMTKLLLNLNIIWTWIQHYWKIILLSVIIIIFVSVFKRRNDNLEKKLEEISSSYSKEIIEVRKSYEEQLAKENKIKEERNKAKLELETSLKKETTKVIQSTDSRKEEILKEIEKDPSAEDEKFSETFGIKNDKN